MTSDLKHDLETMAEGADHTVEVDGHDLEPRIRRRRHWRSVAAGVAGVAVVAAGAYAVLPRAGTETPAASGAADSQAVAVKVPARPYKCGATFPAPTSVGSKMESLELVTATRTSDGWTGSVRATVTNLLPPRKPLIAAGPGRDYAVVLKNQVVARVKLTVTNKPATILPGKSHTWTDRIDIRACSDVRLPAGPYLLYLDYPADSKVAEGSDVPTARIDLK